VRGLLRAAHFGALCSAVLLLVGSSGVAIAAPPTAPMGADEIVEKITRRVAAQEDEYPGTYSRRQIVRKVFDPDDGSLRKLWEIEAEVWDFIEQKQQMKVLGCRLDGKETSLEDCEPDLQGEPMLRIFGPDGKKNYQILLDGEVTIDGARAYKLKIVAREKTGRHFEGVMYFSVESLQVLRVEGGLAKYPFGLKALALQLDFEDLNGTSIIANGTSDLTIYVPLLYNERIVTEFKATDQKRLKASERPKD
jgi:hypothetical protein